MQDNSNIIKLPSWLKNPSATALSCSSGALRLPWDHSIMLPSTHILSLLTSVSLFLRAMERSSEVLHSCLCHFCGLQLVVWFQLHSHKNEHRQLWLQQRWRNAPSPNSPSTFSLNLFVSFHFLFYVSPFSITSLHYMLFDVWVDVACFLPLLTAV